MKKNNALFKSHLKTIMNEISYGLLDCDNLKQRKEMAKKIIENVKTSIVAWSRCDKPHKHSG